MSRQARLMMAMLQMMGMHGIFSRQVHKPGRNGGAFAARRFRLPRHQLKERQILGRAVITIGPGAALGGDGGRTHLVFLHGGAYVIEASSQHRRIAKELARRGPMRVSVVDYPLAPEHQVAQTLAMAKAAWLELARAYPGDRLALMGDSAGGGLALALAQELRDTGETPPWRTVLFSPWLDLCLDHPGIPAQEATDPVLDLPTLRHAAGLYAGGLPLADPRLSPLRGELAGLGPIALFASGAELLLPDCRALRDALAAAGVACAYHEQDGLPHDWLIFGLPESRRAMDQILAFLRGES